MLELLVLKNALEYTSQRLKRTSGARVMIQTTLTQYVNKVNINKKGNREFSKLATKKELTRA